MYSDTNIFSSSLYECALCHAALDRLRMHYGGLSCYSCMAFFRRICKKGNITESKKKKNCKVSFVDRVSCPPCRYQKCIKAGMKPIVNDDKEETNDVKSQAGHTGVKKTGNNFSNHNMEKRSRPVKHENVLENSESEEEVDIFSPK